MIPDDERINIKIYDSYEYSNITIIKGSDREVVNITNRLKHKDLCQFNMQGRRVTACQQNMISY